MEVRQSLALTTLVVAMSLLVVPAIGQAMKDVLAAHRGPLIPQIDLNDRDDLQTVVSEHPKTYMGHPSSVLLEDGKTMVLKSDTTTRSTNDAS